MGAHRTVVKHSYLSGDNQGMGRAQAHVRYIQFRGGKDKDEEQRSFFNGTRDEIYGNEVKQAVGVQDERSTVMHKLILSPGVQGADVKEYCREVMAELSSRKGLDLEWYGVQHDNTDNPHVHIVVMGKDENGRRVRLTKNDYTKVKEAGDRYLERNRLLDREEKDKERDSDKGRSGPVRIFEAIKAAAREFNRVLEKDEKGDERETKFEQRKREKNEERQHETSALGESVDLNDYLAKQAGKEDREGARKEKAWKDYCQPIKIDRGGHEPVVYDRSSSLQSLRELQKDYTNEDAQVRAGMTDADSKRLNDWTKEKYRDEKRVEQKAEKLESIDVVFDDETKGNWSKESSLEDLRRLETMNTRAEVYLDAPEQKALANWIKVQELKEPIRIEVEPGSDEMIYDKEDSKESLQFLASEYGRNEHWATASLTEDDFKKVKVWIQEKDREKEREDMDLPVNLVYEDAFDFQTDSYYRTEKLELLKALSKHYRDGDEYARSMGEKGYERLNEWVSEAESDPGRPIKFGKDEEGRDKFLSPRLEKEVLEAAREELQKAPDENKADIKKLDRWIDNPKSALKKPGEKTGRLDDVDQNHDAEKIEHQGREFNKYMPLKDLQGFREELKNSSAKDWLPPEQFSELCSWIGTKEKYGDDAFGKPGQRKDRSERNERDYGDKKPYTPRRKQSAREKLMERVVRQDRSERWNNYYKEKSDQRERLETEKANLQGQKRALNKFEKERETVDGQYSEIWGADKSAIAAGPKGAATGGLRPLGANQLVKLLTQAKNSWEQKQKAERLEASKTQKVLEHRLTEDKKIAKPTDKAAKTEPSAVDKPKEAKKAEKNVEKEEAKEEKMPVLDNSNLETDTKQLGKEIQNKKKKEEDRDPHKSIEEREEGKHDPFKHDPWGRW